MQDLEVSYLNAESCSATVLGAVLELSPVRVSIEKTRK